MQFKDIVSRVQHKCDDPEGTYITPDYVMGLAQDVYEWIFDKIRLADSAFDEQIIVLPGVTVGSPDLNQYQASGQPLATLIQPRIIRWKLPGQDDTFWRRADGPLDYVRDIAPQGLPFLDSWAWIHYSIKLSKFSAALDIEINGEFLFDPLTAQDSQIQISQNANRAFASKLAAEVGKARGNPGWITNYTADADEAIDDLLAVMVKGKQGITNRVGRMSRGQRNSGRFSNTL